MSNRGLDPSVSYDLWKKDVMKGLKKENKNPHTSKKPAKMSKKQGDKYYEKTFNW